MINATQFYRLPRTNHRRRERRNRQPRHRNSAHTRDNVRRRQRGTNVRPRLEQRPNRRNMNRPLEGRRGHRSYPHRRVPGRINKLVIRTPVRGERVTARVPRPEQRRERHRQDEKLNRETTRKVDRGSKCLSEVDRLGAG